MKVGLIWIPSSTIQVNFMACLDLERTLKRGVVTDHDRKNETHHDLRSTTVISHFSVVYMVPRIIPRGLSVILGSVKDPSRRV